jgi:hypothetical protein
MTTNGTLVNSIKGIKVEVSIGKGIGKGAEKEFVTILFSEKPSQNVLNSLKLKHFRYFKQNNTWSAYRTKYSEEFALSLIKENKEEEKTEEKKPSKPSTNSKGKKPSTDELLAQILGKLDNMDSRLTALESKKKSNKK